MSPAEKGGGPAFPHAHEDYPFQRGMQLRDWFAGQALAGMLADANRVGTFAEFAQDAFSYADAMIAERSEQEDDK